MKKKGLRMDKKGLRRGFLNNPVSTAKSSSSPSAAPASSHEAQKRHLISELQRISRIRNEYNQIRKASNRSNDREFLDDREREAFETFHVLLDNADIDLLHDPDVIQAIEPIATEHDLEVASLEAEEWRFKAKMAKEYVISCLVAAEEVRIVRGNDIGKKGKVLGVNYEEETVALRFLNGEEVALYLGDVAHLGSMEEDNCLMKLMGVV